MATTFDATVRTAVTPTDEDDPRAAHNGKREGGSTILSYCYLSSFH